MTQVGTGSETESIGFLLRQLGFYSAEMITRQIDALGLTTSLAGILRAIAADPGRSQQVLSVRLGLTPARMVAYLNELEDDGYIERRRNRGDRRQHMVTLTAAGEQLIRDLSTLDHEHELELTAALDPEQRTALGALLAAMARQQGLPPHIHPVYRALDDWWDGPRRPAQKGTQEVSARRIPAPASSTSSTNVRSAPALSPVPGKL